MTFGGSPCPPLWSCISETICDLTNDLIQCEEWNPAELHSPHQHNLQDPQVLAEDVPFAAARSLLVHLPPNDNGKADVYIDDLITACLSSPSNIARCSAATALALHIFSRPVDQHEPLPREDLLAVNKFIGEGFLAEQKRILGWDIDTRRLLISPPPDKYTEWRTLISDIIDRRSAPAAILDSLVGRLVHVSYVMFTLRHFLNRLHKVQTMGRQQKHGSIRLSTAVIADLRLCRDFLRHAYEGVSINLITYRCPTHLYRSDASEHGIGGYSILTGHAWRLELPFDYRLRISLNSLEFVACLITMWCDILAGCVQHNDCLLSQTDSTSAAGWLRKSCFDDATQPVQMHIARKLARIILTAKCRVYTQWFPGDENCVADSLSRDFQLSDTELTHLIRSTVPIQQIPAGFSLSPLPTEISSWLILLLRQQPEPTESPGALTRSKLSLGFVGLPTCNPSVATPTHSLTTWTDPSAGESLAPSLRQCGRPASVMADTINSQREQLAELSAMWHRPSGYMTGLTHDTTTPDACRRFYLANSLVTATETLANGNKKQ